MQPLPQALYTAQQTREIDELASKQLGIPAATLMRRAGRAALQIVQQQWPKAQKIVVVCGTGNNGGDGYEFARQAMQAGLKPHIIQLGKPENFSLLTKAAAGNYAALDGLVTQFETYLPEADLVIDALFGTGLDRAVSGDYQRAVEAINQASCPVFAMDIPSGIHADTGNILGLAVKATATLSFIGLNQGLFTADGAECAGKVFFDDLSVPSEVTQQISAAATRIELSDYSQLFGRRHRNAHKGLFGHLLSIGGDHGMSGAIRIAAEAAARVGAGLNSVATRELHALMINQARPEIMAHGCENPAELTALLQKATALVLGPGLGQQAWGQQCFDLALQADAPKVIDADALNLLSQNPQQQSNWILTPHPGEAARLLNCSTAEVQADRFAAVRALQQRYGGVIVLKGAGTLVYDGAGPIHLCNHGNPGMSSGGMGDALAGVIGGLLAQQFDPSSAACAAVVMHSMAADMAAQRDGERGLLAMDLMPFLRQLANFKNNEPV
jgi:NAD(P)H-hydrate epimerase